MPTCVKCGYWDDTDAEFDQTRTICEGCLESDTQAEISNPEENGYWEEDNCGRLIWVWK